MKHTPGPWKEDGSNVIASDGLIVAMVDGAYGSEIEANTYLIAAAPDLLAACKLALAGEADDDTILNALADAVALAEGGGL